MPYTYHLKDVNNHDIFVALTLSSSINFKVTVSHNIIQTTSLKLLKLPGLPVSNFLCPFLLIISQFPLTFFHHLHLVHKINH